MRGALETLAAERLQERALFLGFVEDPGLVYAALDLLVAPSRLEGVPLVLNEAASHGVPVIASDLPGIRSATLEGATAVLVPAGDAHTLAGAIQRLRDDESARARLIEEARRHASSTFAEDAMVERYADLLDPDWRARPAPR